MDTHRGDIVFLGAALSRGAESPAHHLPEKGTRQLMFGFASWSLSTYHGGVGLRYYLREKTALRFGLDVNGTKDDDSGWKPEVYPRDETAQSTTTREMSDFSVGLGGILERHFRSSRNIVPLAGLGVFWWYDKYESDETVDRTDRDYTSSYVYDSRGHTIEGLLPGGLQWHFAPNMSLGGEYRIKLKYFYREYESTRLGDERERIEYASRSDYDLSLDSSQLWLAIAF